MLLGCQAAFEEALVHGTDNSIIADAVIDIILDSARQQRNNFTL